ncbi:hypothetical protein L211DRAFT_339672 [Terfezia boudieri ATCC MYA-4762]|uniref:ARS-binding protein 1 N-terminal domain-containing protein n=1 Tax=Terfezia boudieri ATCC MYA-4762 TaxID=1051890 RepID=A0A3N4LH26_9PEZI|nr:hypothetical protein L211DRAFT_339672 [Terfezia boudieri ATCC MYA-4762]
MASSHTPHRQPCLESKYQAIRTYPKQNPKATGRHIRHWFEAENSNKDLTQSQISEIGTCTSNISVYLCLVCSCHIHGNFSEFIPYLPIILRYKNILVISISPPVRTICLYRASSVHYPRKQPTY